MSVLRVLLRMVDAPTIFLFLFFYVGGLHPSSIFIKFYDKIIKNASVLSPCLKSGACAEFSVIHFHKLTGGIQNSVRFCSISNLLSNVEYYFFKIIARPYVSTI